MYCFSYFRDISGFIWLYFGLRLVLKFVLWSFSNSLATSIYLRELCYGLIVLFRKGGQPASGPAVWWFEILILIHAQYTAQLWLSLGQYYHDQNAKIRAKNIMPISLYFCDVLYHHKCRKVHIITIMMAIECHKKYSNMDLKLLNRFRHGIFICECLASFLRTFTKYVQL